MPLERASPHPGAVLSTALMEAASILEMKNVEVARLIGTSPATVSRLARGRELDPDSKEGELALLFVRVFRSLDAMLGGDGAKARAWFHAHNHHLAGVPAERVLTVQGLVDTARYLDAARGRN